MKIEELVMLVYKVLPHSERITDLVFEKDRIIFNWMDLNCIVTTDITIWTFIRNVESPNLFSSSVELLFERLIRNAYVDSQTPVKESIMTAQTNLVLSNMEPASIENFWKMPDIG